MKSTALAILATFITAAAVAQAGAPRFAKYPVSGTGCSVYLPAPPEAFEKSLSEDGSEVYVGEVTHGDYFFAVILVQFTAETAAGFETADDKTALVESYLDFLKGQFDVAEAAGYGRGHTLDGAPLAVGVIDFWKGRDGVEYAVKSWCDGKYLGVLALYGPKEYPHFNAQQVFLNGFRFPGQ